MFYIYLFPIKCLTAKDNVFKLLNI